MTTEPLTHLASTLDETLCGMDRRAHGVMVAADPTYPHKRRCKECLRWWALAVRKNQERLTRRKGR